MSANTASSIGEVSCSPVSPWAPNAATTTRKAGQKLNVNQNRYGGLTDGATVAFIEIERKTMSEEIKVSVVKYPDRTNLVMRYTDPMTGRQATRSARTTKKREAERNAAKWEADLRAGRYHQPGRMAWEDFRDLYDEQVARGLADNTQKRIDGVFNVLERTIHPQRLADVNEKRLSYYQSELRRAGQSEDTIKSHLSHIKAALNWAVRQKMIPSVPAIDMPRRAKGSKSMRGRAITLEEFERMQAKVVAVVGEKAAPSWSAYLDGLWMSGLRLEESLVLSWDRDDGICVELSPGKRPMLLIPAECEKGNQDRLLPMAPEFAEYLGRTPIEQRTGYVFAPMPRSSRSQRLGGVTVGRTVGEIGEKAGVKVNTDPVTGKVKFASAHDLRRAFGYRWSTRVMPAVLKELLRHRSIDTTMRYYVGQNAQATADVIWEAHSLAQKSNSLGNSRPIREEAVT